MRNPLSKALWWFGFLVLGVGLFLLATTLDSRDIATAVGIVGFLVAGTCIIPFLMALTSAIGYARLKSGAGLIARWHVTAGDWDRFRAYDAIRTAEHPSWVRNDLHIREQTPPQGVDVIVGRGNIIVDGSYHGIAGLDGHGREINWLGAPADPECIEFPKAYYARGWVNTTLRVPVPAAARAEGVRVFEHYRPRENPILNPAPARVRRDGVITLVLSLFVVVVCGALLALLLGAPIPKFLLPDSVRIVKPPAGEEASLAGSFVLVGFFMFFGLAGSIAGLWLMIFRRRHATLTKVMAVMLWLFFGVGILLQLVFLWINGRS